MGAPESMYSRRREAGRRLRAPGSTGWNGDERGGDVHQSGGARAHVAFVADGGVAGAAGAALPAAAVQAPDVILRLSVVPGQMKFDSRNSPWRRGSLSRSFTRIPTSCKHNFVLGQAGSLAEIGQASDRMASSPTGLASSTSPTSGGDVLDQAARAGQTVTFQFRASAAVGQYPYVVHVPVALADDERHAQRRCAAARRARPRRELVGGARSGPDARGRQSDVRVAPRAPNRSWITALHNSCLALRALWRGRTATSRFLDSSGDPPNTRPPLHPRPAARSTAPSVCRTGACQSEGS